MVKILGLPFDTFVDEQISIRQKRLALLQKTPQDLSVFNSNTAWVRLSSGVKIEQSRAVELSGKLGISQDLVQGITLARKLVLWGGISSFTTGSNSISLDPIKGGIGYGLNNAYGFLSGPEQGLKPPPGITGITCDYKNNGSLKQATVTMKCYTRSQFEALEAVYLRLGYTVVLEWGNTLWYNNKEKFKQTTAYSVPNMLFKSDQPLNPIEVAQQISNNKKNTAGNYDGMVGRVANYSWTLGDDLSFDIKLYLISAGDIIESLKMNVGGTNSTDLSEKATSKDGIFQNILAILVNKEASKLNAFLYELVQTVFRDATKKDGSKENKEKLDEVDKQAKAVGKLAKVQEEYGKVLDEYEKYYTLFNEGAKIHKAGTKQTLPVTTAAGNTFSLVTTVVIKQEDQVRFGQIAKEFNIPLTSLFALYSDDTLVDEQASAEAYKASLDNIRKFFTNLKVSDEKGEGGEVAENIMSIDSAKDKKAVIGVVLAEGNMPYVDQKIPGGEFKGGFFVDSQFKNILDDLFNLDSED